ncbi:MAG: NeuD/PglB/VioB family sugar acetyltransferase [Cytophagales bacterium]|nr:NeuD/PglB/VioB family sugar acetyltransferase [Cytophagales bacterium]
MIIDLHLVIIITILFVAKDQVIIFGAGGHAKSIISIIQSKSELEIFGILIDSEFQKEQEKVLDHSVLGGREMFSTLVKSGISNAVVGIGDNKVRADISIELQHHGFTMVSPTHQQSLLMSGVRIGLGTIVHAFAVVGTESLIGNNTIISANAVIGHNCVIGNHCQITPGVLIGGGVNIGDYSFLGLGSVVLPGVNIGKNTIIGANAVVNKDLEDNAVLVGNPGKVIKYQDPIA